MLEFLKKKPVIITLISVAAAILVVAGAVAAFHLLQKPAVETVNPITGMDFERVKLIKISPVSSDKAGVDLKSAFSLKCELPVRPEEIKSSLTVNGKQDYELKKVSDKEFLINFAAPLASNTVYKFEMVGMKPNEKYAWAFQTKKPLKLLRTLPRDKATEVPVKTGIEMTMSYESLEDFESHFSIDPVVPGRFERHKKTVVFIPKNGLEYAKIYTVTLKKGIKLAGSADVSENDYTFQFQTAMTPPKDKEDYSYLSIEGNDFFNTATKPVFLINASEEIIEGDVGVEVYQIPDPDSYLKSKKPEGSSQQGWAKTAEASGKKDVSAFSRVVSLNTKLTEPEDDFYGRGILQLPETLKEGYYLMKVSAGKETEWSYFQVNDIVTYINLSKNKYLFWVNNASTHQGVESARIESKELPQPISTDASGIAAFDAKPAYSGYTETEFRVTVPGHPVLLAEVGFYNDTGEDALQQEKGSAYMKYIYLDRNIYLPKDKINFFGIIRPRTEGSKVEKAKITLTHSTYDDYYYDGEDSTELDSVTVEVSPSGVFHGELNVKDVEDGYLQVNLFVDDVLIYSKDATVGRFEKPTYTLSVQANKKRMFAWDTASFEAAASFYEGSPANGLKLKYKLEAPSADGFSKEGNATCDVNGKIKVDTSFENLPTTSWHSYYTYIEVENADSEVQELKARTYIDVYPSDLMISANTKTSGQNCTVSVETNKIVLDKPDASWNYDCKGDPIDGNFKAVIKEYHNEKIEDGEEYDPINKVSTPKYRYEQVESVMREFDFQTSGGKYQFDFPFEEDEAVNKGYRIVISGVDSRGTAIEEKTTFNPLYDVTKPKSDTDPFGPDNIKYYSLVRTKTGEDLSVNLGEKVEFALQSDQKDIAPGSGGKCLFMLQRNGLVEYLVTDSTRYSFEFTKEFMPNVYVQAVYFDGGVLNATSGEEVRYNPKQNELKIEAKLDKEQYTPGDTVNVEFKVTDTGGRPVAADMNVSVVEESLLENYSYGNDGDVLNGLFGFSDPDGSFAGYCSHVYPDFSYYGGGHGGAWGETPVIDQKETPLFQTFTTDKNGFGKVSFTAPKTLTTWDLTFQGYNDKLLAGGGKTRFTTRVPFFADMLVGGNYLTGDKLDMILRAYGTSVQLGDGVQYDVTLENAIGEKKNYTVQGTAGEFAYCALDPLKPGFYKLDMTASYKDLKYSIRKEFNASDNLMEISRVSYNKLADGITFNGSPSAKTRLMFYNNSGSMFYDELNFLSSAWGERIDQKLSRIIAGELLKKYFNEEPEEQAYENDLLNYQQKDGGISLLTYGDTDPELTAKVFATAKERFDRTKMVQYFYDVLENKDSLPEDVASAYWGLAAAGESVLLDVQSLIASDSFNGKSKLYLALALAELGDFDGATAYLKNLLGSKGKTMDLMTYVEEGKDRDEYLENTALCAILAIKTRNGERVALHNYLKSNRSGELLFNLERLIYLTELIPDASTTGKFKYSIGGKEKEVKLEKSETFSLDLRPDELKQLKIYGVEGDMVAVERYMGPVTDLVGKNSDKFSVNRRYEVEDISTNTFKQSDFIKIVLTPEFSQGAADGLYEVTDLLPAGFRYVDKSDDYDMHQWYPSSRNGQKLTFNFYYSQSSKNEYNKEIVYYARAVSPGDYTADYCAMRQYDTMESTFAERQTVTIAKK